jgi:hypothetical protein
VFCLYLLLVGLESLAAYSLACEITPGLPGLIRYVLLALFVPVAVVAWYLKHEPLRAFRAAVIAAVLSWTGFSLVDNGRVLREYVTSRPPDKFRTIADYLVAKQIKYAYADYWDAYIVDFLAREQVIVASTWKVRIREYQRLADAHRAEAATLVRVPCTGGAVVDAWCVRGADGKTEK